VRISRKDSAKQQAILFSTHFDSFHGSPGASDSGACVVVLLESMRALIESKSISTDLALIFLFNGNSPSRRYLDLLKEERNWVCKPAMDLSQNTIGLKQS